MTVGRQAEEDESIVEDGTREGRSRPEELLGGTWTWGVVCWRESARRNESSVE